MSTPYDFPPGQSRRSRAPLVEALDAALAAAYEPGCAKDHRGAAVWHHNYGNLTAASNGPPRPFACDNSDACKAACGKLAVHAEMRAVLAYLRIASGLAVRDFTVLHIRIFEGAPVPSGPPSCISCSRDMLEAGARSIWLWHETGWREYPAAEFHALSLQHEKHRLPVATRGGPAAPRRALHRRRRTCPARLLTPPGKRGDRNEGV